MVLLTLKNLQQQTFTLEIELTASVRELKEKIQKENGTDYPADDQKLIYAGKILQDDTKLDTYNIDTKKFLVIMVTKPKPASPSLAPPDPTATEEPSATEDKSTSGDSASAITSSSSSSVTATSSVVSNTSSSTTTTTTSTTSATATVTEESAASAESATAESLIVMGEEFNRMVENIMEMGYNRAQVERALRASFNNPYTAVQYLVDGIPSHVEASSGGGGGTAPSQPRGGASPVQEAVAEGEEEALSDDPLEFLRNQPQFNQMRQMIRSNPELLDAFIQQIGQTNPELLRAIQENQEGFVRMLNESSAQSGGDSESSGGGSATPASGGGGSPRVASGQNTIVLSPQDRIAIERLKTLGNFPEDVVVQAYFACEKNENLAAEFLFSQTWD